jgi:hypothetical protein
MTASEEPVPPRNPAVRLQHRAFFEALQHDEGSRDWLAARAGLLLLRHVVAWSDANWDAEALVPEEVGVTTAIAALPTGDPERLALRGVLDAVYASVPTSRGRGAVRRQRAAELVADALIVYGDALLARAAWVLAADVYTTVWDTRAAPDGHFNGGSDPRDVGGPDEESEPVPSVSPASALAALHLAMCYRMLHRATDAAAAYAAASAAAMYCRDPRVGESVTLRVRLGEALMTMDRGDVEGAERQLAALVEETATDPRLADVHAQARRDHAAVSAARRAT